MNYDQLHPEAKKFAESLGMTPVCTNPYFNSVAQVVEIVHSAYEGLRLFDELIAEGVVEEPLVQPTRFGSGASAVEVPRGILFHEYAYDDEGLCTDANCIIPTGQNHANIQADFDALLARAHGSRQDRGRDAARVRDARARLRPLHLVLDALS